MRSRAFNYKSQYEGNNLYESGSQRGYSTDEAMIISSGGKVLSQVFLFTFILLLYNRRLEKCNLNFKKLKEYSLDKDFNIIMNKIRNDKKVKNIFQKLMKDGKIVKYSFETLSENLYQKTDILNGKSLKEYGKLNNKEIVRIIDRLYYGRHSQNEIYFKVCENIMTTIIKLFIESTSTDYSFIGKVNSNENIAISKLSNFIVTSDKDKYLSRIKLNVEEVSIELLLNNVNKFFNIKDTFFLSVLKRFYFESTEVKKYLVELNLIILDIMLNNERVQNKIVKDYFTPKRIRDKGEEEYNRYRNGRTYPSFIRYFDTIFIISGSKIEAYEIESYTKSLFDLDSEMIYSEKLKYFSVIDFLDYKISIKKENITLSLTDSKLKEIKKNLKKISNKCKRKLNYYEYVKYVVEIFYNYRICTSFKFLITSESNRLFRDLHHSKNIRYGRGIYNDGTFEFTSSNKYRKLLLNFWKVRELSNLSFSRLNRISILEDFSVDNCKINVVNYIINRGCYSEYIQYIPALLEKYNFKCPVSGKNLSYNNYEIHRIIPRSKGGKNEMSNLIILHKDIHKSLHSKDNTYYNNKTYKKLYNKIHK